MLVIDDTLAGVAFVSVMVLLICSFGIGTISSPEASIYKKLYLNQKAINKGNYDYWLDFFTRYGALIEIQAGEEEGERRWILATDALIFHRREAVYAFEKWIRGDWGDEDVAK